MSEEYDLALRFADQRLDDLLNIFRRSGIFDDTVFILASDHGELIGEYDAYAHRKTMFEPVLHVPLVIAYSGWSSHKTIQAPTTLVRPKEAIRRLANDDFRDSSIMDSLAGVFTGAPVIAEHRSQYSDPAGIAFVIPIYQKMKRS
jgi:glucan phosphoethanolaminetransferase (alkaline phosphatase superfamily)